MPRTVDIRQLRDPTCILYTRNGHGQTAEQLVRYLNGREDLAAGMIESGLVRLVPDTDEYATTHFGKWFYAFVDPN